MQHESLFSPWTRFFQSSIACTGNFALAVGSYLLLKWRQTAVHHVELGCYMNDDDALPLYPYTFLHPVVLDEEKVYSGLGDVHLTLT